jgi:hypothetical protein
VPLPFVFAVSYERYAFDWHMDQKINLSGSNIRMAVPCVLTESVVTV